MIGSLSHNRTAEMRTKKEEQGPKPKTSSSKQPSPSASVSQPFGKFECKRVAGFGDMIGWKITQG